MGLGVLLTVWGWGWLVNRPSGVLYMAGLSSFPIQDWVGEPSVGCPIHDDVSLFE